MAEAENQVIWKSLLQVMPGVLETKHETSLLQLLKILISNCNDCSNFLLPTNDSAESDNNQIDQKKKATELTCWLLSELLLIDGAPEVCNLNVNLLVTMLQIISVRDIKIFIKIIQELFLVGELGSSILFDGEDQTWESFSRVGDMSNADPKPRTVVFTDSSQLDTCCTTVVTVLGELVDYLHLHVDRQLDRLWLLIGQFIEAGGDMLRASALSTAAKLILSCGLPRQNIRKDYLLEGIGATLTTFTDGKLLADENEKSMFVDERTVKEETVIGLTMVLEALGPNIEKFLLCMIHPFMNSIAEMIINPQLSNNVTGELLSEVLKCYCNLMDLMELPTNEGKHSDSLKACVKNNMLVPQVVHIGLDHLVLCDLQEILPQPDIKEDENKEESSSGNSRKRKYSDTEASGATIDVMSISSWWNSALQFVSTSLANWNNDPSNISSSHIEAITLAINTPRRIMGKLTECQVLLQFLSEGWLLTNTEILMNLITTTNDPQMVSALLVILEGIVVVSSVVDRGCCESLRLWHSWIAAATLPWLQQEMNWLDLKPQKAKQLALTAAKLKWTQDPLVKSASIGIISVIAGNVAPQWRSHVIRAAINERQYPVMKQVATWFPVMVSQMGSTGGQQLVGEVLGHVLHSPDTPTTLAAVDSLKNILCAILGLATFNRHCGKEGATGLLHCKFCASDRSTKSSQALVDRTLVSHFLRLLTHDEASVVVSVVSGLPAVVAHASLSSAQLQQYLALLEHHNDKVVTAVCQQLHLFVNTKSESAGQVEGESALALSTEVTAILSHLQHLMRAGEGENMKYVSRRQLRALEALHYIVKCPLGSIQGSVFNLLFSCLISRTSPIVDAHTQLIIQALAENSGMRPCDLYMRFSNSCAQVLSKCLQKDKVSDLIHHITRVFNWSSLVSTKKGKPISEISAFVNSQIKYLLPVMLIRTSGSGEPGILVELAACANLRLRDLIIDNFQYILSHLIFNENEQELECVLKFIGTITELKLNKIRDCTIQHQVHELIMGLHDHRAAVLRELSRMISQDEATGRRKSNTVEEIANFLELKILGILNFLDNKLPSTQTMKKEKMSAFWCLSDLLCILGPKKVSPVCHKVLSSLKSFSKVRDQEFYDIGCSAWTNFLTNLDESTLEGLIEEVIVIMMPLIKERPQQLAPLLSKILLETSSVRTMLGNIPMLPDHPDLAAINQAIADKQVPIVSGSSSDVVSSLKGVIQSLSHESRDVRVHALSRLRRILAHNQDTIHFLTTSTDTVHPTVSELFSLLIGQCRSGQDEEVQNLVAECLGMLGAIDPSRLYRFTNIKEELGNVHLNIETESFVLGFVSEISRAFLAATDASTQTCASYALQEVLRYYGIRERGSPGASNVGSAVWDRLPYQTQESLRPLFKSKYMAAQNETQRDDGTKPIYGHKRITTFHHWLTRWATSLIDLIEGERPKQIFHVCKPIMRRNTRTAMYILPFVLVCVVCESSRHHQRILREVLAVMSQQQQQHQDHDNKAKELEHLAIQTVFSVLDYLSKWSQKQRQVENPSKKIRGTYTPSQELKLITEFLESIPGDLLAQTSFKCQAFSRALLHIETHLKDKPQELKEHLKFIQEIYVCLDEPDGVEGVAAIRQVEPTLDEQIIQHEANGRLQDALGCYERICAAGGSEDVYQSMLDCYLNLNQPHSVLNITSGLMANNPEMSTSLVKYGVEAAWQLGKWDQLETFLSGTQMQPSWGVGVGEILLAVRSRDANQYHKRLCQLREQQITPLSAANMEKWAYQRAYPLILKLHMISEMEELFSCLLQFKPKSDDIKSKFLLGHLSEEGSSPAPLSLVQLVERWNKRQALVQTSQRYLEPLLNFRRTLLSVSKEWVQSGNAELSKEVGLELERLWLQSAKVARKAGHVQQGEWALLGAGVGSEVFLERGKWHWVKGEQHQAVQILRRGIDRLFINKDKFIADQNAGSQEERIACGKAALLLAKYSEESATQEANTIKQLYADAVKINKRSEDANFHNAMWLAGLLNGTVINSISNPEYVFQIINCFAISMKYGCRNIYQSMPRMLGLWLDFGASVNEEEKRKSTSHGNVQSMEKARETLARINKQLKVVVNIIPNYMFFTALPQLISRICHSHSEVFSVLANLIATMLTSFPKQAMWHMIAVSKSSYQMRVLRCHEIFELAKRMDPDLNKFIQDSTKLADKFLELSNKTVEKGVPQISLNNLLRGLPRLISDSNFSSILLPLQQQMTVTLPTASENLQNHQTFPRAGVYVAGVEDCIEIMQSLMLPKKITLRGTDGKQYIFLCKPKDDLRKDCRLMEFNSFVNRCLLHDPESRKRDLRIKTYTVIPLNEECGLLEWVSNLIGFRHILHKLFKDYGVYMTGQELRACMCKIETPLATKRDIFLNKLVPRHPPLMGEWFLRTFPDPQAWLQARLGYCRTTAVMSMIGYILGLGDRHGENILLDASNGDCVHVDFNCLFNKGESFDWPERVPFRLTHNMVAAMGPTGTDGVFRKACEVTMRVMREEREALMSVLRPFVHDPLVEWSRGNKTAKNTGEIKNEKAVGCVSKIESRLSGQNDKKTRGPNLPLSVEGQVNILIEEATSIENLCQMYIGWAAYM